MQDFLPGQRWISNAEIQMGLGTVLSCEHRTVTIVFMATSETRTYAKLTAPLTRVVFSLGDKIKAHDGWTLKVSQVEEQDGLILYRGTDEEGNTRELPEGELDNFIKLNRPTERLFSGQIDKNKWFELRQQSHVHANRQARGELLGLTGVRTSLIPHQLYIANEVANRYAPRVLLADEVGLGKTIEAGMIIHQQLLTERAKRVLIVVPESLIHQWLVEMLRRFNLHFSIFDEARCQAIAGFHSEDEAHLDA
ncbi:RNA polymerase associated protein RapA, partial [hydrothermal vent metagenome]